MRSQAKTNWCPAMVASFRRVSISPAVLEHFAGDGVRVVVCDDQVDPTGALSWARGPRRPGWVGDWVEDDARGNALMIGAAVRDARRVLMRASCVCIKC